MTTDAFLANLVEAFKDAPLPMSVEQWVAERCANALRLAAEKTGVERAAWIVDARYYRIILERLKPK